MIDVVVNAIPPLGVMTGGLIGFQVVLSYDPAKLSVTASDPAQLLTAAAGSSLFDVSDPIGDSDGAFTVAAVDIGASPAEAGAGVLVRLTLQVAQGVSGAVPLALTNVGLIDSWDVVYNILEVRNAQLVVGGSCP